MWWGCLLLSSMLALATRLFYLTKPYCVVWDETHFGKMTSMYINRTYFFDVHPPGGKLVLTLFAVLSGYNGTFQFPKPGVSYEGFPEIMYMRLGCALLGAALVPLAFCSAWMMTKRLPAALIAAVMVVAETGTLLLSKFILLDSPLLFFMMATFTSLVRLHVVTEEYGSFSGRWWTALVMTGVMLGCVVSVKFVGLFMVAVVGLYTIHSLWDLYANTKWLEQLQHFLARVVTFIFVPIGMYISFFAMHDFILSKSDSVFYFQESINTPGFQMVLEGNNLFNLSQPKEIAFGNLVTIRNNAIGGSYLHSHNYTYPTKTMPGKKQQVTQLGAKDGNNYIRLLYPEDNPDQEDLSYSGEVDSVMDGDMVRLYHQGTGALIGCTNTSAPVTNRHYIVYSNITNITEPSVEIKTDSLKYLWTVKIVRNEDKIKTENATEHSTEGDSQEPIYALSTRVRFECNGVRPVCYLTWTQTKLPHTWGFSHEEVSCARKWKDLSTEWIFEENINANLPNVSFSHLRSTLPERFIEAHQVMKFRNNRMKYVDVGGNYQKPWMWPIGYSMHPWFDDGFRIVLLANPVIMFANLAGLFAGAGVLLWQAFCRKRDDRGIEAHDTVEFVHWCRWLVIAYLLHYLPFYAMDRILYYHHYFPALQFSSLLTAVLLGQWVSKFRSPVLTLLSTCVICAVLLYSFIVYCFIVYGVPSQGPYNPANSTFRHLRLFDHWEI